MNMERVSVLLLYCFSILPVLPIFLFVPALGVISTFRLFLGISSLSTFPLSFLFTTTADSLAHCFQSQ